MAAQGLGSVAAFFTNRRISWGWADSWSAGILLECGRDVRAPGRDVRAPGRDVLHEPVRFL